MSIGLLNRQLHQRTVNLLGMKNILRPEIFWLWYNFLAVVQSWSLTPGGPWS